MRKRLRYRIKILKEISKYIKGVKKFFVILLFVNIGLAIFTFIEPRLYEIFVDQIIISHKFQLIKLICIGYFGLYFLRVSFNFLGVFCKNKVNNKMIYSIRNKQWNSFFDKQDFSSSGNDNIGDIVMTMNQDLEKLTEFTENQTIKYLISFAMIIVSGVYLFAIEWHLAVISIVVIPVTIGISNCISEKEKRILEERRVVEGKLSTWIYAVTQGWREIRFFNLAKHENRKYVKFLHQDAIYNSRWINYWVLRRFVVPAIKDDFIMQFGMYFIGGLLIVKNYITIGNLLVFIMYYNILSSEIQNISNFDSVLTENMPQTDRVLKSIQSPNEDSELIELKQLDRIQFKDVSFRYNEESAYIVENFNMEIQKGDRIALIGPSGKGKSTLVKLMLAINSPTRGQIIYNNQYSQSSVDKKSIFSHVCYVMQENILFNTTIRENFHYANDQATDEMIQEACIKACIWDFITSLPDKLDTVVGEKGVKLSGGQRQRIALARGFVAKKEVFIFDEVTSALDRNTESIINDTIAQIPQDAIVVIISHRQTSYSLCNRKIYL